MKILITGGAGFIGSNLINKLHSEGYDSITIIDNLHPQIHGEDAINSSSQYLSIKDKVTFIHACVTDKEVWHRAMKDIDVVVHLAAETGTGQSMYEIYNYTNVNVQGTAHLLEYLATQPHHVKKVIVASSRAIYGEGAYKRLKDDIVVYPGAREDKDLSVGEFRTSYDKDFDLVPIPTDESAPVSPTSVYGISKYTQEAMVISVCKSLGINAVALRYQNVYGPGQSLKNPYTGILSIFSTLLLNGKEVNIFEDGEESRDFVFITDVVEATYQSIVNSELEGTYSINIGSGVATTVIEVVEQLISNYGIDTATYNVSGNYRLGDIRHNFADISLAQKLLGFTPKVGFNEGVKRFTNWVKGEKVETSNFDESIQKMKERGLFK